MAGDADRVAGRLDLELVLDLVGVPPGVGHPKPELVLKLPICCYAD